MNYRKVILTNEPVRTGIINGLGVCCGDIVRIAQGLALWSITSRSDYYYVDMVMSSAGAPLGHFGKLSIGQLYPRESVDLYGSCFII